MILTSMRSGSHFLESSLKSHPLVETRGEMINVQLREAKEQRPKEREEDLLDECLKPQAPETCTVGFIAHYSHLRAGKKNSFDRRKVLKHLLKKQDLRIIYLRRENLLAQMLSLELMMKYHLPHSTEYVQYDIVLDLQKCLNYFKDMEQLESVSRDLFSGREHMDVAYSSFLEHKDASLARVQKFLGLPEHVLTTKHVKQNRKTLQEVITNYDEIAKALTGTKWESFLIDEPAFSG